MMTMTFGRETPACWASRLFSEERAEADATAPASRDRRENGRELALFVMFCFATRALEGIAQRKLQDPIGSGGGTDHACGRQVQGCVGPGELRMVDDVERLGTELELMTFIGDEEIAMHCKVQVIGPGAAQNVPPRSSELIGSRSGEAGGVEPTLQCGRTCDAVAGAIRERDIAGVGVVEREHRRIGQAALRLVNGSERPAANDLPGESA